jgi:hypothetical protein
MDIIKMEGSSEDELPENDINGSRSSYQPIDYRSIALSSDPNFKDSDIREAKGNCNTWLNYFEK